MTVQEIFKVKNYLDWKDVMIAFNCGRDRAYAIIRAIKYVSDITGLSGKVTEKDYYLWSSVGAEDKA